MRFDAAIFDFDGTLVDTVRAKIDAYYTLLPDTAAHRAIVAAVLKDDPEGSRHVVIPRMAERAGIGDATPLIAQYGEEVRRRVHAAEELPGASAMLKALHRRMALYVASNTPEADVREAVEHRGWTPYFEGVHGYPERKVERVERIIRERSIAPGRVAVVGDGASDEAAASAHGCAFFKIAGPGDLKLAARALGAGDV